MNKLGIVVFVLSMFVFIFASGFIIHTHESEVAILAFLLGFVIGGIVMFAATWSD